jgi:hypothetical protein
MMAELLGVSALNEGVYLCKLTSGLHPPSSRFAQKNGVFNLVLCFLMKNLHGLSPKLRRKISKKLTLRSSGVKARSPSI